MAEDLPDEAVRALWLFNEKAEKLLSNSFSQWVLENKSTFNLHFAQGEAPQIALEIPDGDAVDAFVLTVRFFCQDNEVISLRNIATVYDDDGIPDDVRDRFRDAREKHNRFLDSPSTVEIDGEMITNRKLWETFLYGELAHANPEKKELYDYWMTLGIIASVLRYRFCTVLTEWLRVTDYIRHLNLEVLEEFGLE